MKHRIAQLLIRAARRLDPPKRPLYNVTSGVGVGGGGAGANARLIAAEARLAAARREQARRQAQR